MLSKESLESDWVETEVAEALRKEHESGRDALFPVRIADAIVDSSQAWARDLWNKRNVGDMTEWSERSTFESQFATMLRWLQSDGTVSPSRPPGKRRRKCRPESDGMTPAPVITGPDCHHIAV